MKLVRIFSDSDEMAEEIALCWHKKALIAAKDQQVFSVVLSGGSAAPLLYKKLAEPEWKSRICWNSIHIFFTDERCVPPHNKTSK